MTTALLLPVFISFVIWVGHRELRRPRVFVTITGVVLLASAQYGYLLLATRSSTPYLESSVSSFGDLWHVASGAQFSGRFLGVRWEALRDERAPLLARLLLSDVGVLLAPAVYGVVALRNGPLRLLLVGVALSNAAFALTYDIPDIDAYLLPTEACIVSLGAVGLSALSSKLPRLGAMALGGLALLAPLALAVHRYPAMDRSGDHGRQIETEALLRIAGSHAAILSPDFETSEALWYFSLGEGLRESADLHVVHHVFPREIAAYLRGIDAPFLPEERRRLSPGLTVFAVGPSWDEEFQTLGVSAITIPGTPLRRLELRR